MWNQRELRTAACTLPTAEFPGFGNGKGIRGTKNAFIVVEYDQRTAQG